MEKNNHLLDFDELNIAWSKSKKTDDDLEELLISGYILGIYQTADNLLGADGYDDEDIIDELLDLSLLEKAEKQAIDGKTYHDRFEEAESDAEKKRILETEYHRFYETGAYDTAEKIEKETGKKAVKTWHTMLDDKVRDTHDYLENVSVPLKERFYTYDNDSALFPSGFKLAENNVNCRCWLEYGFMSDDQSGKE